MAAHKDHTSNTIEVYFPPKKIISVVPSQTELLYELGLDEEVIGITHYCIHPKHWQKTKSIIGGTKKLNLNKIKALNPDLIIANKEENEKDQIEELQKLFPVWTSNIATLEEALDMIDVIGKLTNKEKKSLSIQNDIKEQFSHFKINTASILKPQTSVLYIIWRKPFICVGKDTFISHLLSICGLQNIQAELRYPEITTEQIQLLNPQYIFLSSEPYPFKTKHITEFQKICPTAKVILVDGEMFSWYGSRLLYSPSYFEQLLLNL